MAEDVKGVCPGCGHCTVCGEKREKAESEVGYTWLGKPEVFESILKSKVAREFAYGHHIVKEIREDAAKKLRTDNFLFNLGTYVHQQLDDAFRVELPESLETGDTYIVATRRWETMNGPRPWEYHHGYSFLVPREWIRDDRSQDALHAVTEWFEAIRAKEGLRG